MPDGGRITSPHGSHCSPICLGGSQQRGTQSSVPEESHKMLKIEKDNGGCVTRLRLSGRIQSDQIASIRSEMSDDCTSKILDLREVTLVDLAVVQFLIKCEDAGVQLLQCPAYVREWMLRERTEAVQSGS